MDIARKWCFARAEVRDYDAGVTWIAEARARTGIWVIRELDDAPVGDEEDEEAEFAGHEWTRRRPPSVDDRGVPDYPTPLFGAMFCFPADGSGDPLLNMTIEQREWLSMPDAVYQQLNIDLKLDEAAREMAERDEKKRAVDAEYAVKELERERGRLRAIEQRLDHLDGRVYGLERRACG
jgi:hypothetical protein